MSKQDVLDQVVPFCATPEYARGTRYGDAITVPFIVGDWVYATNLAVVVRVVASRVPAVPASPSAPNVGSMPWEEFAAVPAGDWKPLPPPQAAEYRPCPHCRRAWDGDRDYETSYPFLGLRWSVGLLHMLSRLPRADCAVVGDKLFVRFMGGQAVLMPMGLEEPPTGGQP